MKKILSVMLCAALLSGFFTAFGYKGGSAMEPPAPKTLFQMDAAANQGGFTGLYEGETIIANGGEASFTKETEEVPYAGCSNAVKIHVKDTATKDYIYTWQPYPSNLQDKNHCFNFNDTSTNLVFETWFKTSSASGVKGFFAPISRPNNVWLSSLVMLNGDRFEVYGKPTEKAVEANRWYYIAAVLENGYLTVYVDGAQIGDRVPLYNKNAQYVNEIRSFVKINGTQDNYIADYRISALSDMRLEASSIADGSRQAPVSTQRITLDFNMAATPESLAGFTLYENEAALPQSAYNVEFAGENRKRIAVNLQQPLQGMAEYRLVYADVCDFIRGTAAGGAITFTTENPGKLTYELGKSYGSAQVVSAGFGNNNDTLNGYGYGKKFLNDNVDEAYVTYYQPNGVYDFEADIFDAVQYQPAQVDGSNKAQPYFSVSADGVHYTPVAVRWETGAEYRAASNTPLYREERYQNVQLPEGTKYLRVYLKRAPTNTSRGGLWGTLLYRVILNDGIPQEPDGRLTAAELITDVHAHQTAEQHPRIVAAAADFARVRELVAQDESAKKLYNSIKSSMDWDIATNWRPPAEISKPDDVYDSDLAFVRNQRDRIMKLGLLYQVSGNEKYAQQAYAEMEVIAKYKHWRYGHFLYTAEMTNAFAVGYDWCYDAWTPAQRKVVSDAIISQGLRRGIEALRAGDSFAANDNNWLVVCMSGLMTGALAVAYDDPDLAAEVLEWTLYYLEKQGYPAFEPEGGYAEGMGYWEFATQYLVYAITSLEQSAGTSYGITAQNGIRQTGLFPQYMLGPTKKIFNFADAYWAPIYAPQCYWFAEYYQNPAYAYYQKTLYPDGKGVLDLLWYPEDVPQQPDLPLAKVFQREEGLAFFRSSWEDDAIWAALMAGDNQSSHGDLDNGNFMLEANGVRWTEESGNESYSASGYFDSLKELDGRWDYYRKRAEGHNTLVINPAYAPDQYIYAQCGIDAFAADADGSYAIADLTEAYNQTYNYTGAYHENDVQSVRRGMQMFDGKRQVAVQDELQIASPADVWWFMHTSAQIDISNGGKTATLALDGKYLRATLVSPADAQFEVRSAEPFETSPHPKGNSGLGNVRKLSIHLQDVQQETIKVVFTPVSAPDAAVNESAYAVVPMAQWRSGNSALQVHTELEGDTAWFSIENSGLQRDVTLIQAVYNGNSLQAVQTTSVSLQQGQNRIPVSALDAAQGERRTLFVWDGLETMVPVSESKDSYEVTK